MIVSLVGVSFFLSVTSYNYNTGNYAYHVDKMPLSYVERNTFLENLDDSDGFQKFPNNLNVYTFEDISGYSFVDFDNSIDMSYIEDYGLDFTIFMEWDDQSTGVVQKRTVPFAHYSLNLRKETINNVDTYICSGEFAYEYEGLGVGLNYIPYIDSTSYGGRNQYDVLITAIEGYNLSYVYYSYLYSSNSSYSYEFNLGSYSPNTVVDSIQIKECGFTYFTPEQYALINDESLNDAYNDGVSTGIDIGYGNGYKDGKTVGYSEGYTAGMNGGHITEIFANIFQVGMLPVNIFLKILNFNVYGVNVAEMVSALLTIAIVIIVLRTIFGGKSDSGGGS